MKPQTTSILLCALLFTTFGHEYRRAHHVGNHLQAKDRTHHHKSGLLPQFNYRDQDSDVKCGWRCPIIEPEIPDVTGDISIIFNENTNVLGVVNKTAKAALILDLSARLVAVFNGTTGGTVVVNLETQSGVYILAKNSKSVWIAGQISFEAYFSKVSLKALYKEGQESGETFSIRSVAENILEEVAGVLVVLSAEISLLLKDSVGDAITILLTVAKDVVGLLTGTLKGLLNGLGNGLIRIAGDLKGLLDRLRGLDAFFAKITGGLEGILKKVKLNVGLILGAESGLSVLHILLKDLAVLDLTVVLGEVLGSLEVILGLIVRLGGHTGSGLDGLVRVIYEIVAIVAGDLPVEKVIDTVATLSYHGKKIDLEELTVLIKGILTIAESQKSTCKNVALLKKFIANINLKELVVGKIKIAAVIEVLAQVGKVKPLDLIVKLLVALGTGIELDVSVAAFLLNVLLQLNTTQGIQHVQKVFVGIKININLSAGGDLVTELLKGVNVGKLLKNGLNVLAILKALPVVGSIVSSIAVAVQVETKGSTSLEAILKSPQSKIVPKIKAWLSTALHIKIGGAIGGGSDGGIKGGIGGIIGGIIGGKGKDGKGKDCDDDNKGKDPEEEHKDKKIGAVKWGINFKNGHEHHKDRAHPKGRVHTPHHEEHRAAHHH